MEIEGRWIETEISADGSYSTLSFLKDGVLLHSTHHGDMTQVSRLTFKIEGNQIVSNQPSSPREERTTFTLDAHGQLVLTFNGLRTFYRRP